MRKITKDEFIERCQKIHPDWDFSEINFEGTKKPLIVKCKKHGEFRLAQASQAYRETQKCPHCDLEERKNFFIQKAKEIHEDKYDYSKVDYKTNKIPVIIICHEKDEFGEEHGEFLQAPGDHLKGYGCSKCSRKYKPTTEEWIKKAKLIHPDFDYSKVIYKDNKTPVVIICKKHNEEFAVIPNNFIKDEINCPKCRAEYKHNLYTKTTEQFIEDAKKIHGNKYIYDKVNYINKDIPVTIICPEHGEFEQRPSVHLSGWGCKKCTLKTQTKIYNILKQLFPNEEILFEVGEETVDWIEKLRFDIYFPKYNIAVEYDGQQHFMPVKIFGGEDNFVKTQKRDYIKNKLCSENNCKLFRIPYNIKKDEFKNILQQIKHEIEKDTREPEYVESPKDK